MTRFTHTQHSFANGEISRDFFGRGDLVPLARGCSALQNMDILPSGGITRRVGTSRLFECPPDARLINFSVSANENYLLILSDRKMQISDGENIIQELITPWNTDGIKQVQFTQRFDTMILVHKNHRPMILQKSPNNQFALSDFRFANEDSSFNRHKFPFIRFPNTERVALNVSSIPQHTIRFTVTASALIWTPAHIGAILIINGVKCQIAEFTNAHTVIVICTDQGFSPGTSINDWFEVAFSNARGWPSSVAFHQNRLVFGGSRDFPAGIWMSRTGDHFNFDVGTGLDDEAIFLTLLSDKRQQVCTIVSGGNLQILTNTGEWAIQANPLTPTNINVRMHTNVGSKSDIYLAPQRIEGQTVFVSRDGKQIRELVLDDLNFTYSATDLCAFASHLMTGPADMAFHNKLNRLFVVQDDGTIATLTKIAPLEIHGWASYKTDGMFKSVAVMRDIIYVIAHRASGTYVEKFDVNAVLDSGEYGFTHTAAGLPLFTHGANIPGKIRINKLSARVLETRSLCFYVDGRTERAQLPNKVLGLGADGFTGDVGINLIGISNDALNPTWTIMGDDALPTTVLSVTTEGRYSI